MAPELGGERGGYADVAELAAAARAFDAVEGEDRGVHTVPACATARRTS